MTKYMQNKYFIQKIILIFLLSCFSIAYSQNTEKMCWAHYVSWGFNSNNLYDTKRRFTQLTDRSILGEWVSTDIGVYSTTRLQIEAAIKYGIDGFCIDVITPESYIGAMKRMYEAAEGFDFKISMCIDPWHDVDTMTSLLEEYFKKYGHHPNNCYLDGKPVFFIYNPGPANQPEDFERFKQVLDKLKNDGYEGYWIVQPMRENTLWDKPEKLKAFLQVFDGLYDFGSNGLMPDQLDTRLDNGRKAIDKYRPGGILVGGITPGYNGPFTGFYRPFGNTKTLRDNWQSCINTNVDWVCITTWNDYIENTHFEPSVWNRDVLLRLNKEYLYKWRGETPISRPAELMVSYHQECDLGDDCTIEIVGLPYTTEQSWCEICLKNVDGKIIKKFPAIELNKNNITIETLRVPEIGLQHETLRMNVFARLVTELNPEAPYKQLYPITIRPSGTLQVRTVRFFLNDILDCQTTFSVNKESNRLTAKAGFESWSWTGKAELLCNSHPIAEKFIAKEGSIRTNVNFDIKDWKGVYPRDEFIIRFSRADGRIFFTKPILIDNYPTGKKVKTNIIVTGSDFDEGWGIWRDRISRLPNNIIRELKVNENEIFSCEFPMDMPKKTITEIGGWSVLTAPGKASKFKIEEEHKPNYIDIIGPEDSKRQALYFDGNDMIALPVRLLPHGSLTVEAWIRPEKSELSSTIFSDRNNGACLQIAPSGKIVAKRSNLQITSTENINDGLWYHVAMVYDGKSLSLYINGKKDSMMPAETKPIRINSIGSIGAADIGLQNYGEYYKGYMGGLCITGRPLEPSEFKLN